MITTLTGNNAYLVKADLDRLVQKFVDKHGSFGLQKLDGEEVAYDQIREALESLPFLAAKKLVVLRSPSSNKEFLTGAEQLLGDLSATTDVIIHEPKLDKRSNYYKYLNKNTDYKEFSELDEYGLAQWLVDQAKAQASTLQTSDATYLVERIGVSQLLLSNELNKLVAYDPKITRANIDLLTEPTPQSTIFQLLDATFAGNAKRALTIYQEQRANKVEPQAIIAMLTWQLQVLAIIKTAGDRGDAAIASEAKINPFVVRKTRQIAHNLTLPRLKQLISQLLQLDISLKTTAIDADDAVQNFLLSISAKTV